jgi:hypothetical protein
MWGGDALVAIVAREHNVLGRRRVLGHQHNKGGALCPQLQARQQLQVAVAQSDVTHMAE